jgi:hypothetical protein
MVNRFNVQLVYYLSYISIITYNNSKLEMNILPSTINNQYKELLDAILGLGIPFSTSLHHGK